MYRFQRFTTFNYGTFSQLIIPILVLLLVLISNSWATEKELVILNWSEYMSQDMIKSFEKKYKVSSDKFIAEWSAEDLKGLYMEYVEWSGEYQLALRLNERLFTLKSIENVT